MHKNNRGVAMNAYELCQRNVVTVRRHEELTTAARMMRERHVGCLVVVEPAGGVGGERPIGMLTDRDIVTRVITLHDNPRSLTVEDVMRRQPETISAGAEIEDALQRMRHAGVRRAPVVNERGALAGILAIADIFDYLIQRPLSAPTPIRRELRRDQA
jgi:CBS domain-containing protein